MADKQLALAAVDRAGAELTALSDAIWDHPEVGYHESFAADAFCRFLTDKGFQVERGLAGIPTAFCGSYGSGGPVIGLLGEFDALPGMSQKAGGLAEEAVCDGGAGHACGHNLLGVGAMAAALAVKAYLDAGHPGTVKFFGCPAEEGGSGKGFMARAGVFRGLDIAFSWHPGDVNSVSSESTMANYQISYRFHGVSSHAAISPELGRSALDALELMNVGVQFLREHVPTDTRIHYAITDTGGSAPGTVQPRAEAVYLLRAVQLPQVKELYERVNNIARGAALMTDTSVEITFIKACSNTVLNTELRRVLQRNLEAIPCDFFDQADMDFARQVAQTFPYKDTYFEELAAQIPDPARREAVLADKDAPLHAVVMPLLGESQGFVSSDVGDVSWNCPVAQIGTVTMPAGTPMHSWQAVAVGKSPMAHKGMLYAAKVLAASAIDALEDPEIILRAREEFAVRTGGKPYDSPIPADVKPRIP